MRKYLNMMRNWRVNAIAVMIVATFVLLLSECDSVLALILTKVAGLLTAALCCLLVRRWERQGKISELTDIMEEDEV